MKKLQFFALLLAFLLLVGCGATGNTAEPQNPKATFENAVLPEHISTTAQPNVSTDSAVGLSSDDIAGYVWKMESFSCSAYIENARTLHSDEAGGFYVLGMEDALYTVYHCDGSGIIQSATELPVHGDQRTTVGNIGIACGADAIWFDYTVTASAGGGDQRGDYSYYIAACDYNGNLLFSSPREELVQTNDDAASLTGLVLYGSNCVISTEHQVVAIDNTGTTLWQTSTNRSLYQMCLGADGQLYFMTFADGDDLVKLDSDTHEISDSLMSLEDGMYSLKQGVLGYDLLLEDAQSATSQIYGLMVASGEKTPLFNLGALGIITIGNIMESSDGLLVFDYFSIMGSRTLGQLVQTPMSNEVVALSLGVCGSLSATAESAVEMFNSQHTDAYLSVIQYDSTDALNLAIISSEGPDIICFDGLSEEDYARNGYLSDLYDVLGADTKSSLLDQYCQEYETDGHLYRISPVFCCETMIGNSEYVSAEIDSFSNMLSVARSVSNDCPVFSGEPNYCLQMLIQRSITEFVDYDSNSCDFENEEFEALLSLSALSSQTAENDDAQYGSWLYEVRTENLMDYNSDNVENTHSILGFPKTAILSTRPGDTFGIYASSAHKEIACEFIMLLLSEDMQRGYHHTEKTPAFQFAI